MEDGSPCGAFGAATVGIKNFFCRAEQVIAENAIAQFVGELVVASRSAAEETNMSTAAE